MDYAGPAQARDQTVIADGWKAVGVDVNLYTIPPALDRERQTRSTLPGAGISQAPAEQFSTYKLQPAPSPPRRTGGPALTAAATSTRRLT